MKCHGKEQDILLKKRDEMVFEQARIEIENLKQAAKLGEIEVAYLDEIGRAHV